MSEAFYFGPDNLGIEVYADHPRNAWRRMGRELMMATDPVDVATLLRAAGEVPRTGMPAGTVISHVHLHVGDIAASAGDRGLGGAEELVTRDPWGTPIRLGAPHASARKR